jgi:hypothetical protein
MLDDGQRLGISPMQILEHQQAALVPADGAQKAEETLAAHEWVGRRRILPVPLRDEGCQRGPEGHQRRIRRRWPITEGAQERLGHGAHRRARPFDRPPRKHRDAPSGGHGRGLGHEPRFPDPRFTRDNDEPATTRPQRRKRFTQSAQLRCSTDKPRAHNRILPDPAPPALKLSLKAARDAFTQGTAEP